MIWFIISVMLLVLGIILLKMEEPVGVILILLALLCFGITMTIAKDYLNKSEELKIANVQINNKRQALNEMKQTYYKQPNSQINIDLVNKELSTSINKSISELADCINNYNKDLVKLKTAKKFSFFYPCFVDISELKPLGY